MAQQQQPRARAVSTQLPQFGFRSVKIYPDECLGSGSYGVVCKATCDELPCAAKVLHSALFHFNDPSISAMTRRFKQECEFMGRLKHPCIVQYLGTVPDPKTGRPMLIMELMDESLTKFLQRSRGPIAYHTQVVLSQDIVLALAYLHSNGVIHRDLSSNNVLLVAGSRAKVTDFGMSKLVDANLRMTPLTNCPGTLVYMPPEALTDQPHYTNKLDCFSTGVVIIQIITHNFPEPGHAHKKVLDPKYPTGHILVPVPEVERRKKDIDLIEPGHPLRPIALDCLKDFPNERPSARQLCEQLLELKSTPRFTESVQLSEGLQSPNTQLTNQVQVLQEFEQLKQDIERERREKEDAEKMVTQLTKEVQELQEQMRQVIERERKEKEEAQKGVTQFTQQIQELQEQMRQVIEKERREKDETVSMVTQTAMQQLQSLNVELQTKNEKLQEYEVILAQFQEHHQFLIHQQGKPDKPGLGSGFQFGTQNQTGAQGASSTISSSSSAGMNFNLGATGEQGGTATLFSHSNLSGRVIKKAKRRNTEQIFGGVAQQGTSSILGSAPGQSSIFGAGSQESTSSIFSSRPGQNSIFGAGNQESNQQQGIGLGMNFVATEAPEQGNGTVPLFTIGSNYKGDESQEAIRKARKKRYR